MRNLFVLLEERITAALPRLHAAITEESGHVNNRVGLNLLSIEKFELLNNLYLQLIKLIINTNMFFRLHLRQLTGQH